MCVCGGGKYVFADSRTGTYILQKVYVPLISDKDCIRWHEEKGITLLLYPEMMCAGYKEGRRDACLVMYIQYTTFEIYA